MTRKQACPIGRKSANTPLQRRASMLAWPRHPLGDLDDANKKKIDKLLADLL